MKIILLRFIGDLLPFEKIKDKIDLLETRHLVIQVVITLALNYGGRFDIISAINQILNKKIDQN